MKSKVKKIVWLLIAILVLGVIGRIIYVNVAYPSGRVKMLKLGEAFEQETFKIYVNDATAYDKEDWEAFLSSQHIDKEEEAYNVRYMGDAGSGEKPEYWVMYEPESDYTAVIVEVEVVNKTKEVQRFRPDAGFNLMLDINGSQEPYSDYYSALLSDIRFEKAALTVDVPAEDKVLVKIVYMCKGNSDTYILEYLELGNNQRMKLSV